MIPRVCGTPLPKESKMANEKDGIRILARQNGLTEDDWYALIEVRRAMLADHLRSITLSELGDLRIMFNVFGNRALREGPTILKFNEDSSYRFFNTAGPEECEGPYDLKTRGIFPDDTFGCNTSYVKDDKGVAVGKIIRFWGITRKNEWFKVEVTADIVEEDYGSDQRRTVDLVQKIVTSASNPREICTFCGMHPYKLWEQLGKFVLRWLEKRRELLRGVEQLAAIIKHEDVMLDAVVPNKPMGWY
jgi:hypothetical protein